MTISRTKRTINVTKTYLPPLEEYVEFLKGIWGRGQITNHGPVVLELEQRLRDYLGVKHVFFVANGTIALQIAIKALGLRGDIITTPFSYVATTSSIVWEGCRQVFADIDREDLCMDPKAIESTITQRASAIIATHVYGNPCNVERINEIATLHDLKVIYDAAHAFGVRYRGRSIVSYGDISTLSFHATKLFHTGEGGAIVTNDDELAHRIGYMRNFGHNGQEAFWGLGINGKGSELHAAMGLVMLPKVPNLIHQRQVTCALYDQLLSDLPLYRPQIRSYTDYNYAYYPVLFENEAALLRARDSLDSCDIHPRRYFYPPLHRLPYSHGAVCPVAEDVSSRVLCLPLYAELERADVETITGIIREVI